MLTLMAGAGGLGAAVLLASCAPTGTPTTGSPSVASTSRITLATVGDTPETTNFYKQQIDLFSKTSGVGVDLLTYPQSQYSNAIQLLFTQGKPPNVFRMGGLSIAHPNAYIKGWEQSLQPYVTPDFAARFPYSFDCRTSDLCAGTDIYATPYISKLTLLPLLFYNTDLLSKYAARTDPPRTWSELKETAHAVTLNSGGSVHGFGAWGGANNRGVMVALNALQATAGPRHDLFNYQTGKPGLADSNSVQAVELLRSIHAAGDFPPGWDAWQEAQVWSNFAGQKVAMYIGLNWHHAEIARLGPNLQFDFAPTPVPDAGRAGYEILFGPYQPYWAMGAGTTNPTAAWQLLDFFGTADHQRALYQLDNRNLPALPQATYADLVTPRAKKMIDLSTSFSRRGPDPTNRNPFTAEVQGALVANQPKPAANELVMGAVKEGSQFEAPARQFDSQLDAVFEEQLQKVGHGVTRADFSFADWNPLQEYGA
jgi:multiple sugar transport system substrate-binding protein